MFSGCTVLPDGEESEVGSSNQEASPSASKNIWVSLVLFAHGSESLQLFQMVWIFLRSLGIICYNRQVLSEGYKKLLQGLVSHEHTAYLSIFKFFKLNELWPYYQKHVNEIILNSTTL